MSLRAWKVLHCVLINNHPSPEKQKQKRRKRKQVRSIKTTDKGDRSCNKNREGLKWFTGWGEAVIRDLVLRLAAAFLSTPNTQKLFLKG